MVIDDSAFMRKVISDIVNSDPEMSVVGTACDGLDALEKISEFRPDVITLDVNMPRMDGITTLEQIMKINPLPVIMLSSETREGAETTFKALEHGAIDYLPKPSGKDLLNVNKIKDDLLAKIKIAAKAKILKQKQISPIKSKQKLKEKVIVIGASTGGPPALEAILSSLPAAPPPVLIVQHMPASFTKSFADRLNKLCAFEVKEAEEGDSISRGKALVAPGWCHMTVGSDKKVHLDTSPPVNYVRPAIDPMMETAARIFRAETIGVLLTGMGKDGAYGMKVIKAQGGMTIAQDEATCTVFGMPKAAIEQKCVDKILPLPQIPQEIIKNCQM